MLSVEQNDSQSGENNVIDEFKAEYMPLTVQEAEIRSIEKVSLVGHFCLLCLAGAQKITQAAHSLSRLGELHVKAGCVSNLLAG